MSVLLLVLCIWSTIRSSLLLSENFGLSKALQNCVIWVHSLGLKFRHLLRRASRWHKHFWSKERSQTTSDVGSVVTCCVTCIVLHSQVLLQSQCSSSALALLFSQECLCMCVYVWVGVHKYCMCPHTDIYVYASPLYKYALPFWVYEYISVNAHHSYLYIYE